MKQRFAVVLALIFPLTLLAGLPKSVQIDLIKKKIDSALAQSNWSKLLDATQRARKLGAPDSQIAWFEGKANFELGNHVEAKSALEKAFQSLKSGSSKYDQALAMYEVSEAKAETQAKQRAEAARKEAEAEAAQRAHEAELRSWAQSFRAKGSRIAPKMLSARISRRFKPSLMFQDVLGQIFVYAPPSKQGVGGKPIREGFWISAYEVTQIQWAMIMGKNPSYFKDCGDTCPVESVSWNDIQTFLQKLNALSQTHNLLPKGARYALPSELQWEYACRAGSTEKRYGPVDQVAWYYENSGKRTHPVGQKRPNAWGIYDTLGNVSEWCQDWYDSDRESLVWRGGSWIIGENSTQASLRSSYSPDIRSDTCGFRLMLSLGS